jgi:hypothetical protein
MPVTINEEDYCTNFVSTCTLIICTLARLINVGSLFRSNKFAMLCCVQCASSGLESIQDSRLPSIWGLQHDVGFISNPFVGFV